MPICIPLEDSFSDIIGKAQRGHSLNDEALSAKSGATVSEIENLKAGTLDEAALGKVASAIGLGANALLALAQGRYTAAPVNDIDGLAHFNSVFDDMTVNSFLVWDPSTKEAAILTPGPMANRCWILQQATGSR